MKTVCIAGAGPAGLVAAKTLLQTGEFDVTVFEKNSRLGGIWALDEDTRDGYLHPQTPTNLSRFTVAFSDHEWRCVDLESKHDRASKGATDRSAPPMFPKAWQVNRYLEDYRRKHIPESCMHYRCEVISATHKKSVGINARPLWRILTRDEDNATHAGDFEYLIVASGFFSRPRLLDQNVPQVTLNGNVESAVRKLHSSQFKAVDDLFASGQHPGGKNILFIGGGTSSGEAAAAVAMQLSNAQWSTDQARQDDYKDYKLVHVCARQLYTLPPFNEYEEGSKTYVPIDFKLYDLSKRPPGRIEAYSGQQSPEVRNMVHGALQKMVGGNQSDLGSEALVAPEGDNKSAVYVALTESYSEFVRSGLIEVVGGRVTGLSDTGANSATATVTTGNGDATVDDIGAVVYATGYTPSAALDFLAPDVKRALHYDPCSMRIPLVLEQWQTMRDAVPELALLGFYEGPYWPMMEMQARLTAERWTKGNMAPRRPFEESDKLSKLRQAMREKQKDVPQYWFGDYLGYMEEVADYLQLSRNDGPFDERTGCPAPARYLTPHNDRSANDKIMQDLHDVWQSCTRDGKYVPRAAFRAFQGNWNISRQICSSDPNFSGTLQGKASFHPRFPTQEKGGKTFDFEYIYIEAGTFTLAANGMTMTARRRYVYRYCEADDELSVWFVKPDRDLEVDYLFHSLEFVPPAEARKAGACIAKANHLCVQDMYWTQYTLPLTGVALRSFQVKHTVKGPNKDYVATTDYTRPQRGPSN